MVNEKGLSVFGLVMLALGTVIGGSFFLASSISIKAAGPAISIAFILGGIVVYYTLFALSEMTVADNAPGSFRTFAHRYLNPWIGFVTGWIYWTGMVLAMSSEATAVAVFIRLYTPEISLPIISIVIIIVMTLINLLGAEKLSKLESSLSLIKIFAIIIFILISLALIFGIYPNKSAIGLGSLLTVNYFKNGILGIMGSMLIVIFAYAGFEVLGLAASEAKNPHSTIPRAIKYTVFTLIFLYISCFTAISILIPTNKLTTKASPLVESLQYHGLNYVGNVINIILISAILSTMLASIFGLGRMLRSLIDDDLGPRFLKDNTEVPYKGIIFSGVSMLLSLALAYILPQNVYVFLVSAGGFSLLFCYLIIMLTHFRFRKTHGCPPKGNCQLRGYPFSSYLVITFYILIIISMPLIPGQGSGLIAGLVLLLFYSLTYYIIRRVKT